jgi:hypothetical protein
MIQEAWIKTLMFVKRVSKNFYIREDKKIKEELIKISTH